MTFAGRYRLDDQIASGGMAQVFRGTDEVLRRSIAVKVLHPHLAADETFVTRFRHEAIAVARLSHPAIVNVYDTCSENGLEAIVMELVRGDTLRDRLDEGPLEPWSAANIAAQVAGALDVAHAAGLVHRDIKPANILLSEDGRVKVGDFGIAKAAESADLTQEGSFVGTAKYLAPEQVESKPVDGRTDLYSLGVVLYEMLIGRVPFEGDSSSATALARLHQAPVPCRQLDPGIPPQLEGITMRLLARSPDDRFPTAADARSALLNAGADDRAAEPATTGHAGLPMSPPPAPMPAPVPMRTPDAGMPPAPPPPPGPMPTGDRALRHDAPQRHWLVPTALVVLVAVALGVAGLLIGQFVLSGDDDQAGNGSDGTTPGTTAAPTDTAVAIAETIDFDPPPGDGGENSSRAADRLAADGDPSTFWDTENYDSRNFGALKDGVGLILRFDQVTDISQIEIDSPTTDGWTAEVYVAESAPEDREGWGAPVVELEGTDDASTVTAEFESRPAGAVLVWITRLGDTEGENNMRIDEVRVLT
jgi:serine/threonine-protein kinase